MMTSIGTAEFEIMDRCCSQSCLCLMLSLNRKICMCVVVFKILGTEKLLFEVRVVY